jgi:hypothetical protein
LEARDLAALAAVNAASRALHERDLALENFATKTQSTLFKAFNDMLEFIGKPDGHGAVATGLYARPEEDRARIVEALMERSTVLDEIRVSAARLLELVPRNASLRARIADTLLSSWDPWSPSHRLNEFDSDIERDALYARWLQGVQEALALVGQYVGGLPPSEQIRLAARVRNWRVDDLDKQYPWIVGPAKVNSAPEA